MEAAAIIALATEVAGVINKIVDRLPTYEQKKMEELFKFLDVYETEVKREDADFDDLIVWRNRKRLLIETIIEKISRPN